MPLKPHPTDPDKMVYFNREYKLPKPWVGLTFDDFPEAEFGNTEFLAGARWAARILKERNT
jgi:hypothetical protein